MFALLFTLKVFLKIIFNTIYIKNHVMHKFLLGFSKDLDITDILYQRILLLFANEPYFAKVTKKP